MEEVLFIIIFVSIFIFLLILALYKGRKQVVKDWEMLEYLEKKAETVSTKEEIEVFHKEFLTEASKIHNQFITPPLQRIDGYLRGLYQQYQK